jgi:hypothetical protein
VAEEQRGDGGGGVEAVHGEALVQRHLSSPLSSPPRPRTAVYFVWRITYEIYMGA